MREGTINVKRKKSEPRWDREEVVLLVAEYFRTKYLSKEEIARSYAQISTILRNRYYILHGVLPDDTFRNINGITMQSSRIRCLDSNTKYHGMHPTRLQEMVFNEYCVNPDKLKAEAYQLIMNYLEGDTNNGSRV